ncbi:viral A-type inclusion [Lecanosticta acicola]|uniref:Viral A-type inclusion n=1 Tax=Lecanosticta acicola TaxID=111012 RepID=A0AAI8YSR4_9PEZI|nr:viral A-type inclusion [Lecanosticta acicola]
MANDSLEALIAHCNALLGRLYRHLVQHKLHEEADEIEDISHDFHHITTQYNDDVRRRDQALTHLQQDLSVERLSRQDLESENRRHVFEMEDRDLEIARLQKRIDARDEALRDLAQENEFALQDQTRENARAIWDLVEGNKISLAAAARAAYLEGQQQGAEKVYERERWLRELQISSEAQAPPLLPPELRRALVLGKKEDIFQSPHSSHPLVLHHAALFGELEIARHVLSQQHIDPNTTCSILGASDHRLGGVTPMHLALGAQQKQMLQLLFDSGGSVHLPPPQQSRHGGSRKTSAAPPMWLVSRRWLDLVGEKDVGGVLEGLKNLGWDPHAVLSHHRQKGELQTMRSLARRDLCDRPELQREVLRFLDRW